MLKGLDKWKILNSKEVREILKMVKQQWGCDLNLGCGFLEGKGGDIFLISRDIEKLDLPQLRINSLGLYFGQTRNDELRLSIEGSQIIGKAATKNVAELSDEEFKLWLQGEDIEKTLNNCSGYAIIKHNNDFIGCGKCKEGKILNFVPKARRVSLH
ncbi:hypothetical protein HYU20_02445 [Candidatus Woesearchaeota archaeon]|nr:hypothetical protein [Candidatus Woesearchaeota archaeon]